MIRTAVAGADSRMAGELIRILKNHPDVELEYLCAPAKKGTRVDQHHHGLAGECSMNFSEFIDPGRIDVVFLDEHSPLAEHFRESKSVPESLKVIDMSHGEIPSGHTDVVYGLAELNRRKIVKEAQKVVIPRSIAAIALISLQPLALHMLLPDDIEIQVECPDDIAVEEKLRMAEEEITYWLSRLQNSFKGKVRLRRIKAEHPSERGLRLKTDLPVNVDLSLLRQLYAEQYEDHNFTYEGDFSLDFSQVEGTHKCLLNITSPQAGRIEIEAIADCRLRGGAGDAVHSMNLMFGLLETTGLLLKANHY